MTDSHSDTLAKCNRPGELEVLGEWKLGNTCGMCKLYRS